MDNNLLLVLFALFAISSILFSGCTIFGQNSQANSTTNTTHEYKVYGDPSEFFASISTSRNFSIVMDITNSTGEETQVVIVCAAGVARSWGELGKNVTLMTTYIIQGDACTKGVPGINETINMAASDCLSAYSTTPYTYVSYGPSEAYFSNSSWKIVVDQEYITNSECGFKTS